MTRRLHCRLLVSSSAPSLHAKCPAAEGSAVSICREPSLVLRIDAHCQGWKERAWFCQPCPELLVKGARCGFRVRKEVWMEKDRWDRLHAHYKELILERKSEQGHMPAFCLMDIKIVEI